MQLASRDPNRMIRSTFPTCLAVVMGACLLPSLAMADLTCTQMAAPPVGSTKACLNFIESTDETLPVTIDYTNWNSLVSTVTLPGIEMGDFFSTSIGVPNGSFQFNFNIYEPGAPTQLSDTLT